MSIKADVISKTFVWSTSSEIALTILTFRYSLARSGPGRIGNYYYITLKQFFKLHSLSLMSLIIIKWLKKILKFWLYRLGNWLLKTLDQLTRYTITKYLTGLNLGSVWFGFNYSLHSMLFCISFRWTAGWLDNHTLYKVFPLVIPVTTCHPTRLSQYYWLYFPMIFLTSPWLFCNYQFQSTS